jgi:hypothetical protein
LRRVRTDLGEVRNWSSLVINRGQYLVAGCVMTLRSSGRLQFIERNSGGAQFGREVLAAGEGEDYWRSGFVATTMAVIPAINEESQWFTAMRWRYSGTWHKAGRWRSPACLSGSTATSFVRWSDLFTGRTYPRRGPLLNPKRYPHVPSMNRCDDGTNRAQRVGGEG